MCDPGHGPEDKSDAFHAEKTKSGRVCVCLCGEIQTWVVNGVESRRRASVAQRRRCAAAHAGDWVRLHSRKHQRPRGPDPEYVARNGGAVGTTVATEVWEA